MSDLTFEKLAISNFKTFVGDHDFDLNRKPGLYYITGTNKLAPELGANGVGKSTIWDALIWVLFGRTGRDNRPADAVKPWLGKGTTEVALQFTVRERPHTIIRSRSPNKLVLRRHDTEHDQDIQQEDVPKLLGMTEEMFRRTMVLGQFGTLFLDLKPEAQAQMFTEALDLDVWLVAVDVAAQQGKVAQRAADQATSDLSANDNARTRLTQDLVDANARAEVFETDRNQRIAKGEKGIASLETDLEGAEGAAPKRPALPDDKDLNAATEAKFDTAEAAKLAIRAVQEAQQRRQEKQNRLGLMNGSKPKCDSCGQVLPSKQAASVVDDLHEEIKKDTADINKLVRLRDDNKHEEREALAAYDTARAAYEATKKNYSPKLAAYEAAIRKVASIQGELKRWRDNLKSVQAETNQSAEEAKRLLRRRTELRTEATEIQERLTKAGEDVQAAEFWREGFKDIRMRVIDEALMELEIAAGRHACMLGLNGWGIKLDTSRENKSGTTSNSFTVLLYPPDRTDAVKWESYSGGESQRWQLAFAFALSEVLLSRAGMSPNIEVLDEPTKGLSGVGVDDLISHLRDRALELGRAIYFVDHHSLDKGAFDGTLMITKGKKGSTFAWQ